jgi:osmoprotectant transport system ATP-binding protein
VPDIFELRGVSKVYDQIPALATTDIDIPSDRCTVFIGPSGCGKSTLLRLLMGLTRPTSGTIRFDGAEVVPETSLLLRQRMGYVIQDGGLFPHLTAAQNAALMAQHLGWTDDHIDRRLKELCQLTRLDHEQLGRFPVQLSGGQRQRVGLMRALMLDPPVLLLDEPLGALDPLIRYDLQSDLRRIFLELGKSVILVTHDLAEAAHFADEVVLLRAGSVVQRGPIDALFEQPADPFVTRFVNAQRGLAGERP